MLFSAKLRLMTSSQKARYNYAKARILQYEGKQTDALTAAQFAFGQSQVNHIVRISFGLIVFHINGCELLIGFLKIKLRLTLSAC